MPGCTHVKEGEKFVCKDCGLELTVSKACGCDHDDKTCNEEVFTCCGAEMDKV